MTELGLVASAGEEAAQDVLESVYLVELTKALNPLERKDWLRIHRLFVKSLKDTAEPDQAAAVRAMLAKLDVDWKTATPAQVDKVIHAANKAFEVAIAPVIPKLDKVFTTASETIVDGTKRSVVSEWKLPISASFSSTDERIARFVAKSQKNFVRDEMGRRRDSLSAKARGIVERGMEQGLDRHDLGAELERTLNAEGANRSRAYWNMLASVFMVRARSATTLTSFDEAGIDQFQFESVLDEVTSQVCRFMHGRIFSVPAAMQQIAALEAMDDPDAIREAQPFMSVGRDAEGNQTLYYKKGGERVQAARVVESGVGRSDEVGRHSHAKSDADLQAAGVAVPPLHGLCRSNLVPFGDRQAMGPSRPRTQPQPQQQPEPQQPPPPQPGGVNEPTVSTAEAQRRLVAAKVDRTQASMELVFGSPAQPSPGGVDTGSAEFSERYKSSGEAEIDLATLIPTSETARSAFIGQMLKDPEAIKNALLDSNVIEINGQRFIYGMHSVLAAAKLLGMQRVRIGKLIDASDLVAAPPKPQPKPLPKPEPPKPEPLPKPEPKPRRPRAKPSPVIAPVAAPVAAPARGAGQAKPFASREEMHGEFVKVFGDASTYSSSTPKAGAAAREWSRRVLAEMGVTSKDVERNVSGKSSFSVGAMPAGAAAYHGWTGETVVSVMLSKRCLGAAKSMKASKSPQPSDVVGMREVLHEELHGCSPIRSVAYHGVGVGIEEAGTELLARKAVREIVFDGTGVSSLYGKPPKWNAPTNQWHAPSDGAYHSFIVTLANKTHEMVGGDKQAVIGRLEDAFIKLRSAGGPKGILDPREHAEALGHALGFTPAQVKAYADKLMSTRGLESP